MTARRIYLVYDGILSSVFDSQVLTPLQKLQDLGIVHDLVAFSSWRSFWGDRNYQEKAAVLRERIGGRVLLFRTPPYLGSWTLRYPDVLLRRAMRRLHIGGVDAATVHARGHQASYLALRLKQHYPELKVIASLRGAVAQEIDLYKRKSSRLDYRLTWRRQVSDLTNIERLIAENADAILCVSHASRDYLVQTYGISPDRIDVVTTCTDTSKFRFDVRARRQVRQSLGLDGKTVLVYCGSAHEWELPEETLRAFAAALPSCPDAHLLVLSRHQAEFAAMAKRIGVPPDSITIMSARHDEVARYLSAGDVGLLIRDQNIVNRVAAPTKFAEYLACGLPVVVTPSVGDTESVIREFGTGWVLRQRPENCWSEVAAILNSEKDKMLSHEYRRHCAEVAKSLFSWESQLPVMMQVYQHVEQRSGL